MKQKNLPFLLSLVFVTVVITFLLTTDMGNWKVLKVADGDSFSLIKGGRELEIRLYGIDAPERTQPFYRKAATFTRKMLQRGKITFSEVDRDRYGRTVAWVYVNSDCLNEELVRHGLAWHYKHHSNDLKLARLEDSARTAKAGLWCEPQPIPPWEFRRQRRN